MSGAGLGRELVSEWEEEGPGVTVGEEQPSRREEGRGREEGEAEELPGVASTHLSSNHEGSVHKAVSLVHCGRQSSTGEGGPMIVALTVMIREGLGTSHTHTHAHMKSVPIVALLVSVGTLSLCHLWEEGAPPHPLA